MAKSFIRNAFFRVVEARERQVSRHSQATMVSLDERSLKSLGTTREDVRAAATSNYVF